MIKLIPQNKKEAAYESGKVTKKKGFSRTSPFYEESEQDYWFFKGYDGDSFDLPTSLPEITIITPEMESE